MNEIEAWAMSRNDTVRVRANESGLPVKIHVDPDELRYGADELARTILHLCTRATSAARAERRTLLERDGVDRDILDRLGLPTAAAVADVENASFDDEPGPVSWMESV